MDELIERARQLAEQLRQGRARMYRLRSESRGRFIGGSRSKISEALLKEINAIAESPTKKWWEDGDLQISEAGDLAAVHSLPTLLYVGVTIPTRSNAFGVLLEVSDGAQALPAFAPRGYFYVSSSRGRVPVESMAEAIDCAVNNFQEYSILYKDGEQ